MLVIDNFFNLPTLSLIKMAIENELMDKNTAITKRDLEFEKEFLGLENSKFYILTGTPRTILLQTLIANNILNPEVLNNNEDMLRYHVCKAPYHSVWHLDGLYKEANILDFIGITLFLNEQWNPNDGGLFVYKDNKDDTKGKFIEPKGNRIIINYNDLLHAVTSITNTKIIRYSLQMFINKKYLLDKYL
jgi:hypothetical protein